MPNVTLIFHSYYSAKHLSSPQVLSLSQDTIREVSVGHIVNLASNDVQRFDMVWLRDTCAATGFTFMFQGFFYIQTFWLGPLLAVTVTLILYQQVGWVAVIPTAIVMLQIPLQTLLSTLFSKTRYTIHKPVGGGTKGAFLLPPRFKSA